MFIVLKIQRHPIEMFRKGFFARWERGVVGVGGRCVWSAG